MQRWATFLLYFESSNPSMRRRFNPDPLENQSSKCAGSNDELKCTTKIVICHQHGGSKRFSYAFSSIKYWRKLFLCISRKNMEQLVGKFGGRLHHWRNLQHKQEQRHNHSERDTDYYHYYLHRINKDKDKHRHRRVKSSSFMQRVHYDRRKDDDVGHRKHKKGNKEYRKTFEDKIVVDVWIKLEFRIG
ncbi:hypothetical protein V6N12_004834 [Hibiscus sabdariffa]|uniref:Uncharacterized protein n=1 Tax=Hibiscus sabdariffa TaxID=183260 RepID=A0ABR2CMN4_9ROSI